MPYNNTPITPAKEITGTVSLPLARVKKIIATDDEISNCSNNAAFLITLAAEMFLQHLVEQSYNIVKTDHRGGQSKPRRNIQYRDVANAVARVENLEFLTDVVPKTTTYRFHKQKQTTAGVVPQQQPPQQEEPQQQEKSNGLPNGQSTLDAHMGASAGTGGMAEPQATNGASVGRQGEAMEIDDDHDDHDDRRPAVGVESRLEEEDGDDEGSMHTANDEMEAEPVEGRRMEIS